MPHDEAWVRDNIARLSLHLVTLLRDEFFILEEEPPPVTRSRSLGRVFTSRRAVTLEPRTTTLDPHPSPLTLALALALTLALALAHTHTLALALTLTLTLG